MEDDLHTIQLVSFLLQKWGFSVLTADNVFEAASTLEADSAIQLVILDILLPSVSGVELLKMLKANFAHIKVLIVSAHVGVSLEIQDPLIQDTPKLLKPFRQDRFYNALTELGFTPSSATFTP